MLHESRLARRALAAVCGVLADWSTKNIIIIIIIIRILTVAASAGTGPPMAWISWGSCTQWKGDVCYLYVGSASLVWRWIGQPLGESSVRLARRDQCVQQCHWVLTQMINFGATGGRWSPRILTISPWQNSKRVIRHKPKIREEGSQDVGDIMFIVSFLISFFFEIIIFSLRRLSFLNCCHNCILYLKWFKCNKIVCRHDHCWSGDINEYYEPA